MEKEIIAVANILKYIRSKPLTPLLYNLQTQLLLCEPAYEIYRHKSYLQLGTGSSQWKRKMTSEYGHVIPQYLGM